MILIKERGVIPPAVRGLALALRLASLRNNTVNFYLLLEDCVGYVRMLEPPLCHGSAAAAADGGGLLDVGNH